MAFHLFFRDNSPIYYSYVNITIKQVYFQDIIIKKINLNKICAKRKEKSVHVYVMFIFVTF